MFFSGTNQELFSHREFYSDGSDVLNSSMKRIIPDTNKRVGERIKLLLDQKKPLKQKDLAEYLGKTHSVVSKLWSGQIMPTKEVLDGLVDFFGVTADYILFGYSHESKQASPSDRVLHSTEHLIEKMLGDSMADQKVMERLLTTIDRLTESNEKKDAKIERLSSEISELKVQIATLQANLTNNPKNISMARTNTSICPAFYNHATLSTPPDSYQRVWRGFVSARFSKKTNKEKMFLKRT